MNIQIKTILILWTLVMILGSCSSDSDDGTKSKFKGGDGSKAEPYQIETKEQLILVGKNLKSHFKVVKDIDLKGEDFKPIGVDINSLFEGTFDGGRKKIKNLKINQIEGVSVGLFRIIGRNGVVKNIGLENVDVKGRIIVGGLVGTIKSGGKVEKSYVTGKVSSKEESVGGIAGQNKGMIKESYSTALVTTNKKTAGGITGLNDGEDALIENSYSTGAVESEDIFGGLVGLNSKGAELKNTYTTGKVEDNANIVLGAFVGSNTAKKEDGKISGKNYWKKGTGAKAVAKGVGYGPENNVEEKTEAELKALTASDTKWDTAIWDFKAGEYPKLKWQSE